LVLEHLQLDVQPGQLYALLGCNGAGKTTLQRLLRGALKPGKGELRVLGLAPHRGDAGWRRRVAWLSDLPALYERLSVLETVRFFAGLYGVSQAESGRVIEQVELSALQHQLAGTLSRGQRQRLAWARALLISPEVFLLDEPTSGLDLTSRHAVHELLRGLRAQHRTLFLATHDMWEAQELADVVGILEGGKIVAQGTPAELCRQYLGEECPVLGSLASLERVYRQVTGRSLIQPAEKPGKCVD
jgi:ABC-type multidrug transport system ATPase subunit